MKPKLLALALLFIFFRSSKAQDLIILKSGDEIENVKILDTLESVIYSKDGIGKTLAKADVFIIKYANGAKVKLSAKKNPVINTPPTQKAEKDSEPIDSEEPADDKKETPSSAFLDNLAKKLKSEGGAEKFTPPPFGFGANISLIGGESIGASILMPLSGQHFRAEFEFGFAGNNAFAALQNDEEKQGLYKVGIGLYGMGQKGRVNLYGGPSFAIVGRLSGSAAFQITPTFGAEYGLSSHFTLGGDIGLALNIMGDKNLNSSKVSLNTRSRFILRFYF